MSPGGYRWWYLDAQSDDGRHALAIIVFVGSVFSPYYAWAGRRDPLDHCAVNVALYGPRGRIWAMTERGRSRVTRAPGRIVIGPSAAAFEGDTLVLSLDETAAPWPRGVRGRVRLRPRILPATVHALDAHGRHHWQPIAPIAEVTADFAAPLLSWRGSGYLDANWGDEPLEAGFAAWTWARSMAGGDALVLYDAARRDGTRVALGLRFTPDGTGTDIALPPPAPLPRAQWGLARAVAADPGTTPALVRTLEDGPFYARALVRTQVGGMALAAFHETLSLDQFARRYVKLMLPVRMPRALY